jgi:hypothetical protein
MNPFNLKRKFFLQLLKGLRCFGLNQVIDRGVGNEGCSKKDPKKSQCVGEDILVDL